jgi:hypothetical protein
MKPAIQLQINTPCHENWGAMTRSEQGRFCQLCSKQVVDFSIMTDQQVLDYLSVERGSICGRLTSEQQQRTLQPAAVPVKVKWWYTFLMPLLLILNRAAAQTPTEIGKVAVHRPLDTTLRNPVKEVLPADQAQQEIRGRGPDKHGKPVFTNKGKIASVPDTIEKKIPSNSISDMLNNMIPSLDIVRYSGVSGMVTDEHGKPIAGVVIYVKEWNQSTITDSAGQYRLNIHSQETITLSASYVGYQSVIKRVAANTPSLVNFAFSAPDNMWQGEVIVVTRKRKAPRVKPVLPADSLTNGGKTTGKRPFTVYPNPVSKGQQFMVLAKEANAFTAEVVNSDGMLLFTQRYTAAKGIAQPVTVPVNWTAGIYFVRLVNEKEKKQYTEKLLVQ